MAGTNFAAQRGLREIRTAFDGWLGALANWAKSSPFHLEGQSVTGPPGKRRPPEADFERSVANI
ncbi:MAG: hypothetical protein AAFR75_06475 [Pseudomonadota bacterium]